MLQSTSGEICKNSHNWWWFWGYLRFQIHAQIISQEKCGDCFNKREKLFLIYSDAT